MVLSKIDNTFSIPEYRSVMAADKQEKCELWTIAVKGIDLVVAIGKQVKPPSHKHIVYYPVYLIKNTGYAKQIAAFEMKITDVVDFTDEEGVLDVTKYNNMYGDPRVYKWVTKNMLEEERMLPPDSEQPSTEDADPTANEEDSVPDIEEESATSSRRMSEGQSFSIPTYRADIFSFDANVTPPERLEEETYKDNEKEEEAFEKGDAKSASWAQNAMKNMNYNFIEPDTDTQGFFESIREAFSQLGQVTTVALLREKLSKEVSQDLFDKYKKLHDDTSQTVSSETANISKLNSDYKKYQELMTTSISVTEKQKMISNARKVATQHNDAVVVKNNSSAIHSEVAFMKNVNSMEELVKKIKTEETEKNPYLADEWAVSTIERILKIKLIILSSENAKNNPKNAIVCSNVDAYLESQGIFEPEFYIILEHTGKDKYKLITYKNKKIFTYPEVPYELKQRIVGRCVQKNSGSFFLIPEFRFMAQQVDENIVKGPTRVMNLDILTSVDPNVVFVVDLTANNTMPGKEENEKMDPPQEKRLHPQYAKLTPQGPYKNWRRKLHNSYLHPESPLSVDGMKWNSVEHYIQASKFKNTSPSFYKQFSNESDTELSKNVDMAVAAGSDSGIYGAKTVRPEDAQVDPSFYGKMEQKVKMDAMVAKYELPEFKNILKSTHTATLLMNDGTGEELKVAENLVKIRNVVG